MKIIYLCFLTFLIFDLSGQTKTIKNNNISSKKWHSLLNQLTKENLKAAEVKEMHYNFKRYNGDNPELNLDLINRFISLKDKFVFSKKPLEIRDWNNERLFSNAFLKNGKEIYLHLAWGYVSAQDISSLSLKIPKDKESLNKAGIITLTKKQALEQRTTWQKNGKNMSHWGPRNLKALMEEKSFKNLKVNDIAFYGFLTGSLTVEKERNYFLINDNRREVAQKLFDETLLESRGK